MTDGYADDASCTECHAEIARTFHDVGMGRSFTAWRTDVRIEDLAAARYDHDLSGRRYQMFEREGALYMRRWQTDPDGGVINEIELKADWVIGSGHHARSYAHQTPAGDLFELPITWYSQTGRWGMSPGYDTEAHPDILRRIGRDCIACHNAYPDVPVGGDLYGKPPQFPMALPEGIGCQRCHGPGRMHVDIAKRADATVEAIRGSIVNPLRLEPARRDDVCLQCHLQPSTAFTTLTRTFGAGEFAFRPGGALHEHLVVIDFDDAEERSRRFEINHHAYRMHQSPCYVGSDGAMTCLTCHDPHRKVPVEARPAFYRDKCLSCHGKADCTVDALGAPEHIALDNCIACHMPQRRPHDVVQAVMTDHFVGIHRDASTYLDPLRERDPLTNVSAHLYWPDRMKGDPDAEVYRLLAEVAGSGRGASLDEFMRATEDAKPDDPEPYARLGDALSNAGRLDEALNAYRRALAIDETHLTALSGLGSTLGEQGRLQDASVAFRRAIASAPSSAVDHLNLGLIEMAGGRLDAARSLMETAADLDPLYVNARLQLASLHMQRGEFVQAADRFRQAMAIEPRTAAYSGWGDALRLTGDWKRAVLVWRHGLTQAPDDRAVALQLAFARLLAPDPAVRNPAEGLDLALQARELEPDNPHAMLAAAAGYLANHQPEDAQAEAERAGGAGADPIACALLGALALADLGSPDQSRAILTQVLRADIPRNQDFIRDALLKIAQERVR